MARDLAVQLDVRLGESYHSFGQNQTTVVQTVGKNGAGWVMETLFLLWTSPLVHHEMVLLSLLIKLGRKSLGGERQAERMLGRRSSDAHGRVCGGGRSPVRHRESRR